MNSELFEALELLEQERGIPVDFMIDRITKAIVTACKNSYDNEEARVEVNMDKGAFEVFLRKEVVDEVYEPYKEITLEDARKIDPTVDYEDFVEVQLDTKEFGRIAAQTARNIIRQGIRDGERGLMMQEFQSKHQELVTATVERVDPKRAQRPSASARQKPFCLAVSRQAETVRQEGDLIKVYIVDVRETEKGPRAMISRTHPDLVKRLFETEVPEIDDGIVETKAVSRAAGSRHQAGTGPSHDPEIDAVGACIGARGARVGSIVSELGGETIDIGSRHSEDPTAFIASASSPANVVNRDHSGPGLANLFCLRHRCRTANSLLPSATRDKMRVWQQSSPAGKSTFSRQSRLLR